MAIPYKHIQYQVTALMCCMHLTNSVSSSIIMTVVHELCASVWVYSERECREGAPSSLVVWTGEKVEKRGYQLCASVGERAELCSNVKILP